MKLLVVEDSESILRLIQAALVPLGLETDTARSGLEAVTLLQGGSYDLVITDLLMPLGTGFDVLDTLAQREPRIPLVVCSAYVTQAVRERIRSYAPVEIVTKPFAPEDLVQAVRKLIASGTGKDPSARN